MVFEDTYASKLYDSRKIFNAAKIKLFLIYFYFLILLSMSLKKSQNKEFYLKVILL